MKTFTLFKRQFEIEHWLLELLILGGLFALYRWWL